MDWTRILHLPLLVDERVEHAQHVRQASGASGSTFLQGAHSVGDMMNAVVRTVSFPFTLTLYGVMHLVGGKGGPNR
jgi:hypothetical protein